MKLVYVVKETTYRKLAPQLESLDRALCALSLTEADASSEALRKALSNLGVQPIVVTNEREQSLRKSGARELLAKTHLDADETRRLRGYVDEGADDLVRKLDSKTAPHLIVLEA